MPYNAVEIAEYSRKIGKSRSTLFKWIKEGCNLRDPKSVREWVTRNTIRETNISKARKRRRDNEQKTQPTFTSSPPSAFDPPANGDLPPVGRKGAAAALERLEASEEEAHRRLQTALVRGDAIQIAACQDFWLKCSETLRRLDLAVETARREAETQVPLRVAQEAQTAAAEWMRISFTTFLSSEAQGLMALKDIGEWKAYAMERFHGILTMTMKNSLKTRSPVPEWASRRISDAWNVSL